MLFRRKRIPALTGHAGPVRFGLESVFLIEQRIGAVVSAQSGAVGALARVLPSDALSFADGLSATGYTLGRALTGRRSSVVVNSDGLRSSVPAIADAVRSRTPFVVHHVCRDDWTDALAAGATGAVVLVTPDIREMGALAVAAHRVAEEVLLPVVCVHDASRIAFASADVPEIEPEMLSDTLPDRLETTGGQRHLFDSTRSSVPVWLSPDRPLGLGARLDGIDDIAGSAGRSLFLDDDLGGRVDRTLAFAAERLGRPIEGIRSVGTSRKAPWIVSAGPLSAIAMDLAGRGERPVRAASCVRLVPFPAGRLASITSGSETAVLLASHPGLLAESLFRALRIESGRPVLPAYFAGGSGLPSSSDLEALARRIDDDPDRRHVFVGARRTKDRPGIPEVERFEQTLRTSCPDLNHRLVDAAIPEPDKPSCIAVGPILADLLQEEVAQAMAGVTGQAVRTVSLNVTSDAPASALTHGEAAAGEAPARATVIVAESAADLDRTGIENSLARGGSVLVPDPGRLSREASGRILQVGGRLFGLSESLDPASPLDIPVRLLHCALGLLHEGDARVLKISEAVVGRLHSSGILDDGQADRLLLALPDTTPSGPVEPDAPAGDPLPPSILSRATETTGGIDDPTRFWRTFGFAHAAGRDSEIVPDPHRAIAAMPLRAGWAPTGSGHPSGIPGLLPELCTGCGACWSVCPEGAILPAAPSFQALFDTGMARLGAAGGEAFQLGRVEKPVVQEAYKVFRDDALSQFRTPDALILEALERVMNRAKLDEEKRAELLTEYEALATHIPPVGLARTEAWFDAAEMEAKGSGRPLLLAVDPDRCTACGACVEACPEDALEPVPADAAHLEAGRLGAAFQAALPPLPAEVLDAAASVEPASRALDARASQAAAGGDGAPMRRASVRAVAVAAEALRGPVMDGFADRVVAAREALEDAIRNEVAGSVSVNDFEAFSRRLAELEDDPSVDRLAAAAGSGSSVDARRLQRLTDVRNSVAGLEARLTHGEGRARISAVLDGDDRPTWPVNPYGFPWVRVAPGSGPVVTRAVTDDLLDRHLVDVALVRHAENLARDVAESDEPPVLDAASLTDEECRAYPVPLLVTDRLSAGVIALLEGDLPVRIALLRSDPTGQDAGDPAIAASALGSACVVQGSLGDARHLARALESALLADTPSLICIHTPIGPATEALRRASAAIRARVTPLFIYRPVADGLPGGALDLSGNPDPMLDIGTDGGRRVTPADWIAADPSWRHEFRWIDAGDEPVDSVDVAKLLDGSVSEGTPVVRGPGGRVAVVPPHRMEATRRRIRAWRRLRAMAAVSAPPPAPVVSTEAPSPEPAPAAPADPAAPGVSADTHARLTARLLALSGFAPGQDEGEKSLRAVLESTGEDT